MKVFIISPQLTMKDTFYADEFNKEIVEQLREYGVNFYEVNNKNISRCQLEIVKDAIIVVYNERNLECKIIDEVQKVLKKAIEKNAQIWPVAIDKEARTPFEIISDKQSYDVWEQLRCRDLGEQYIGTVAQIFARKIIARVFPTCYWEEGEIFLSHRRIDGEKITAKIYDKMLIQAKELNPFRDVVNVRVGDEAQRVIDEVMESSDVFIFLHTAKSGESDWILKELRFALLRQIPVLWVQIDNADINTLKIKPSEQPHLKYATKDFFDDKKLTKIVDTMIQKAFELIMNSSNQILGYVDLLKKMFGNKQYIVNEEKMIYHISVERKGYHYPQRNIEQYYQMFGRTPTLADAQKLNKELNGITADSITILTNRVVSQSVQNNVVFDGIQDFYYHWKQYMEGTQKRVKEMEVVVSGAFPDSDEIFKQSLMDALILFAKAIISNGYELTFGAHPTFQELFYEIAKEISPQDYKERVNMYISEWFLMNNLEKESEYIKKFKLFKVTKKENLNQSLRELRRRMIQRKEVKALVCLGGKVKENKKGEGIREEIELAQKMNIPIFVVGSVGGCSSEVALEYKRKEWSGLNNASVELNQKFLDGIDYFSMAQEMMSYISSDKE